MMLTRFGPLAKDLSKEGLTKALGEMFAEVDKSIAGDVSEEAQFYAWLRTHLQWGLPRGGREAMSGLLEPARKLYRDHPDRIYAYKVLLAAIHMCPDRDAARQELLKPLPQGLCIHPSVVDQRAATYLALDFLDDRQPVGGELDVVLADVERCHGDKRRANYFRAVRTWWEATRPDADAKLKTKVRDLLRDAQLQPGQAGYQRAAVALALVCMDLGEKVAFVGWNTASWREGGALDPDARAVEACVMALVRRDQPEFLRQIERFAAGIDSNAAATAVHSALAAAHAMAGDEDAAVTASARAVLAHEKKVESGNALAPGRGVLLGGRLTFGLQAGRARASIAVTYDLDFWMLPRLPDLERLQRMAGVK